MASHGKTLKSRRDRQGRQKSTKASDLKQALTGQTRSAPESIQQPFPRTALVAGTKGRAHVVPATPDSLMDFQHHFQSLTISLRFPDNGSKTEVSTLHGVLLALRQLDEDNYVASDPERLKQEMKLSAKPSLMSDVLEHITGKGPETSEKFPVTIKKRQLTEEEATPSEMRELVKSKGIVLTNTEDTMGSTVLHHAVANGQRRLAEALLGEMRPIRDSVDKLDRTALHMAALVGDREMVTLLADSKDIDTRDMFGKSSLYLAAENGHTEIVSNLMELGAEPDSVDIFGFSPLFAAIRRRSLGTVKLLLSKDVNVDRRCKFGATPLHFAAIYGEMEIVHVLLESGAKANLVDKMEATPLMLAARLDNWQVCLKLLEKCTREDVRKTNAVGRQAVHYAVANSNLKLVKALIEHGADAEATDEIGLTLLHYAVLCGNLPVVSLLVEKANVDVNAANKTGTTPLHDACIANDVEVIHRLLEHNAKANIRDKNGAQAIHCAMIKGNIDLIKILIEHKSDVEAKTEDGLTPLHVAVLARNLPVVSFLIENAKVDVNVADKMMRTPLDIAEQQGDEKIISVLKLHNGHRYRRKKVPVAGTEKQILVYPQVAAADVSAVPQTQPKKKNPGPCCVASQDEPTLIRTEDPRLRPILKKVEVAKMVNDLEKLLKDVGAEVLTEKNIIFSQRNFAMGVIGPKGGKLAFADKSVTMTIPPDALSDTRVISCFRPIGLDDDDQGRQPNKDWLFCTPELICGPDGTKFNSPITIRFRHSVHVREDGSCRGENVKVVTKGDNKEKWQDEAGDITFDGRWISINIAHFTSVSCAIPRQEPQRDDRFDVLLSTGLTVVPPIQPEGAQAVVRGTPTHLHVFITHYDEGQMQDLKQVRLGMPNNEVSRINRVLYSINPLLGLSIEGHPRTFKFTRQVNPISVQLNQMAHHVTHADVEIAETNQETIVMDLMLILEPDQTGGLGRSVIEHNILRTNYSTRVPEQIFVNGSLADELECSRRHELSQTIPRRPLIPYPIEQGAMPQFPGHQGPQPPEILEQVQPPHIHEEPQLPPEQQVPVIPLEDQIAVQLGQLADQVAALQAQYALLVDVENH